MTVAGQMIEAARQSHCDRKEKLYSIAVDVSAISIGAPAVIAGNTPAQHELLAEALIDGLRGRAIGCWHRPGGSPKVTAG
jgi:hypothetical protein